MSRFSYIWIWLIIVIGNLGTIETSKAMVGTDGYRVGVLLSSFGDIDAPEEARDFVIKTLMDPDVTPLPFLLRLKVANLGWILREAQIRNSYESIGWRTNYRQVSRAQADIIAEKLRAEGYDARGYIGFNFTFPFINDTLDEVRRDGITHLIVVNQGAQYSRVTTGLIFRDIRQYLAKHQDWQVRAIGIRRFDENSGFLNLLVKSIESRIKKSFSGIPPENLCIFLPIHGNLSAWTEAGDPYIHQALDSATKIKSYFSRSIVAYGFLNHEEIPLLTWSQPNDSLVLRQLVEQGCPNILINGRISFTVDSIESLHDQGVAEPRFVRAVSQELGRTPPHMTVESMFNLEEDFLNFQATLVKEALQGHGDLEPLN